MSVQTDERLESRGEAHKSQGYEGECCLQCGNFTLFRFPAKIGETMDTLKCDTCGHTEEAQPREHDTAGDMHRRM